MSVWLGPSSEFGKDTSSRFDIPWPSGLPRLRHNNRSPFVSDKEESSNSVTPFNATDWTAVVESLTRYRYWTRAVPLVEFNGRGFHGDCGGCGCAPGSCWAGKPGWVW